MQAWSAVRYDIDVLAQDWPTEMTGPIPDLGDLLVRWRAVDGQRFLLRSDRFVDLRVNAYGNDAGCTRVACSEKFPCHAAQDNRQHTSDRH